MVTVDARGKRHRQYKREDYQTPYAKLKALPEAAQYLKPGLSFTQLDHVALQRSDTACARRMSAAKQQLLRQCKIESPVLPRFY